MNKIKILILCFALCAWGSMANAVMTVRNISFEGNHVTQESFLRRNIYLRTGDVVDEKLLAESLQALMDTGLFKRISYYFSSDIPQDEQATETSVDLVIQIKEKHYLFLLPRYRIKDGESHVGLQLRWDNLYGIDHGIRLLVENRGDAFGISTERLQLDYYYPNFLGKEHDVNFRLRQISGAEEIVDELDAANNYIVNHIDNDFGISVQHWLNPGHRKYGWFLRAGWSFRQRENDVLDVAEPADENIEAMVLQPGIGYSKVHDYGYNRGGKEFGYDMGFAHRSLYGDANFFVHTLYYRSYYRFNERPMDNLNVQTIFGHASNDVLDAAAFSLGGDDVRGYEGGRFVGNTMLQVNMEYQTPAHKHPHLRYVAFVDLANAWEDINDMTHEGLHAGLGLGIRWKIPSFVRMDLRLDVGYGISDDVYNASAGTHYNF